MHCADCGKLLEWKGKGRWPKYCSGCREKRQRPFREKNTRKEKN